MRNPSRIVNAQSGAMRRKMQTLKLFFLLGALAAAAPPPATAPCEPAGPTAVRESAARIAAVRDDVTGWRDVPHGANLHTRETADEESQPAILTIHRFEGGEVTVEGEGKAVGKLWMEPRVTDTNIPAEDAKLKASSAAVQRRASAVTELLLPLRDPPNPVLLYPKRVARQVTDEERTAFSEELLGAALGGSLEEMRSLIGQGADVNFRNGDGSTALHWAAANDQLEALRLLIDSGANVNTANKYGTTPLHIASWKSAACVVALLTAGANVDVRDQWGWTPLHAAANYDQEEVVQALLWAGADPGTRNSEGESPGDLAKNDAVRVLLPIITANSTFSQPGAVAQVPGTLALTKEELQALSENLVEAAQAGNVAEMRQLIARGADVRYVDESSGDTALHMAAAFCDVEALRFLLDRGAVVDARDYYGGTPLQLAARKGHVSCVEALLAAGADVNTRNDRGWTPLHFVAAHNVERMVRVLLKMGADASVKDNEGKTARELTDTDSIAALLTL